MPCEIKGFLDTLGFPTASISQKNGRELALLAQTQPEFAEAYTKQLEYLTGSFDMAGDILTEKYDPTEDFFTEHAKTLPESVRNQVRARVLTLFARGKRFRP
jgi:hypothetical protein